jgi:L-ribulose-5-phosphate 3-epimerase
MKRAYVGFVVFMLLGLPQNAAIAQEPSDKPMQLAVSTASFGGAFHANKLSLMDFPDLCARNGLEAVELNDFCLNGDWPTIRKLKQKIDQLGLDVCAVAVETNFYRASPDEIERERRHIEEYIPIAAFFGAPLLRVDTSPYNKDLPATIIPKGVTDEMAFDAAVRTFRSLMPLAEKHGITFVLENHGGISRTSADQIKITKAVDSKWFRINLDTGNYHADPMAGTGEFEDFLTATTKVAPYLAFCHAKVWDVTDDLREPTLDYDRFFKILREIGYRGPISIEYMGKKDVMEMLPKCVAMLKRCRAAKRLSKNNFRICHPERSEGSLPGSRQILRYAQDDVFKTPKLFLDSR